MDENEFEDLKAAWRVVAKFIQTKTQGMTQSVRTEYLDFIAVYIGVSRKSVDRWVEGELPGTLKKNEVGAAAVRKLHRFVSQSESGNWRVAEAIGGALELRNEAFGPLEVYRGRYRVFRRGKQGLIDGQIFITNSNDEPWMHYHTSVQDGIEYSHKGPIYLVHGSIYMVGVGATKAEKYFRSMIFKAADSPKTSVTFGILLTELADTFLPLAAKVALVSEDDPRIGEPEFLEELKQRLSIDSKDNVIYGAGTTRF